jgi:hypothetical protein
MKHSQGFTIFFAMLVLGLVFGVGVAIANLSQKQVVLSYFSKQSQVAFYAADTGGECARYWDLKNPTQSLFLDYSGSTSLTCGGQTVTVTNITATDPQTFVSEFKLPIVPPGGITAEYAYCASVTVTKNVTTGETSIASRGNNLACESPLSARKVERAIAITY